MKLNWRQGILYVTIVGMEWGWLYVLLFLLNEQLTGGRLSIIGLWLLYPLAFIFNKLLARRRWSNLYLYLINGLALVIGILLVVKLQLYGGLGLSDPTWLLAMLKALSQVFRTIEPEFVILGSSIILWWLGWRLSRLRVTFATSVAEFQFGLAILLAVFLAASLLEVQLAGTIPVVLTFFLLALLGMALTHSQGSVGWSIMSHRGLWTWLLLASIGLILVLGLLINSVVTADLIQLFLLALKWVWNGVNSMAVNAAHFLVRFFPITPEWLEETSRAAAGSSPGIAPEEYPELLKIPAWVKKYGEIGWNVTFLGVVLVALWRVSSEIFGRLRRRLMATTGAEIEPLRGAFQADLLSLLNRIVLRLLRFRLPSWLRRKPEPLSPEIASVRQVYRQLLQWVAAGGLPRAPFQTPYEYLYTMEELLPVAKDDLRFITQQYVISRYGLSSPTEEELHQLRQSWRQVRQSRLKGLSREQIRQARLKHLITRGY